MTTNDTNYSATYPAPAATGPRYVRWLFQGLSHLCHPLFSLTYAALVICGFTHIASYPFTIKAFFVGQVAFFTLLLPVLIILLLHACHVIGHWSLRNVRDRTIPFITNFVCYTTNYFVLRRMGYMPEWVLMPFFSSVILTLVLWIVSFWWKISAHASGNATLVTFFVILYYYLPDTMSLWLVFGGILLLGVVCTSRLYLGRHTMAQIGAGVLAGILSMHIASGLYF